MNFSSLKLSKGLQTYYFSECSSKNLKQLFFFISLCRVNVVAFDFLGHGESPHINDPKLYTADQVSIHCNNSSHYDVVDRAQETKNPIY